MIGKALLALACVLVVLAATASVLYMRNTAPAVPEVPIADVAVTGKPYVVKMHAQWCPVCMMTKGIWSQIETAYSGRVNLVVFDFTDQGTAERSRIEARRLGLGKFFDENSGWTGTIAVIDPRTKETTATIHGSRDFAEYQTAIDASLRTLAR